MLSKRYSLKFASLYVAVIEQRDCLRIVDCSTHALKGLERQYFPLMTDGNSKSLYNWSSTEEFNRIIGLDEMILQSVIYCKQIHYLEAMAESSTKVSTAASMLYYRVHKVKREWVCNCLAT